MHILLAATLGSMYVITLLYDNLKYFSALPFKFIVAEIMILLSFRKINLVFNIKALSIFIAYSMLLAGICIFFQYSGNYDIGYSAIVNFSYKELMISLMIIFIFIDRIVVYIRDRKGLITLIYDVDIVLGNSHKYIKAFLDTGNELREPATNLPVIIVEKSVFYDIDLSLYDKFYISYRVVSGQDGKLIGFKPEVVRIHQGNSINEKEVIIAFCEERLSNINDYNALLSRGVIM
jgi:stage II sporulation protein GA (sporulation sigma-E factor processing peptidase)